MKKLLYISIGLILILLLFKNCLRDKILEIPECIEECCWCEHLETANLDSACWTILKPELENERYLVYFKGQNGSACCGVAIWENGKCETELEYVIVGIEEAAACKVFLQKFVEGNQIPLCDIDFGYVTRDIDKSFGKNKLKLIR